METRRRELTLNGLFWRYLLTTGALVAGLCLAAVYLAHLLAGLGVVLPAGTGEWNLSATSSALQAQEAFDAQAIPFFYQYALAEDGTILETNMTGQEQEWARQVLAGDAARHGFPYTKYYHTVSLSGGRVCLLQYDYAMHYASPALQDRLPDFQITSLVLLLALILLAALWRTRHYAKVLTQDAQAVTLACQGVAQQDLDAPFPQTAQVRELQAALTALDTLRQELATSLREQWAGEQQKAELLAALAHDLKTPLTVIGGNAELLAEDPLPAPQSDCVQAILRGTRTAEDYVAKLQTITAGGVLPHPQTVSLAQLAQDWQDLGRDLAAPKGLSFSWQSQPDPLPDLSLSADRTALLRAAENLLSNGVRYTPPGQSLCCGVRLDEGHLFFWVQDSGPGFSPQALIKAGKTFYTEAAARPQGGHLGLGLYSAARTAQAHGGGITLQNTDAGGCAALWLPLSS